MEPGANLVRGFDQPPLVRLGRPVRRCDHGVLRHSSDRHCIASCHCGGRGRNRRDPRTMATPFVMGRARWPRDWHNGCRPRRDRGGALVSYTARNRHGRIDGEHGDWPANFPADLGLDGRASRVACRIADGCPGGRTRNPARCPSGARPSVGGRAATLRRTRKRASEP